MKTTIHSTLFFCAILLAQGCGDHHDHGSTPPGTAVQDDHAALHKPKYNETLVEFPGHKYALEIIDDEESGLVTAFLTNAHFEPVPVDAKEVRLSFVVDGKPKSYTLVRTEQEAGKPAVFTLTDGELALLNCKGWQGDASASVEVGGAPYNGKLVKLGEHAGGHAHHH